MNFLRSAWHNLLPAALLLLSLGISAAQTPTHSAPTRGGVKKRTAVVTKSYTPVLIERRSALFQQDCSFCHGCYPGGVEGGSDIMLATLFRAHEGLDILGVVFL